MTHAPPSLLELAALGAKTRAALDKGRARAIAKQRARGAETRSLVVMLALADAKLRRGLAGRISRKVRMRGLAVSERQVQRILATLASVPRPVGDTENTFSHPELKKCTITISS